MTVIETAPFSVRTHFLYSLYAHENLMNSLFPSPKIFLKVVQPTMRLKLPGSPPEGFEYVGCFLDKKNPRMLNGGKFSESFMTPQICHKDNKCAQNNNKDYKYFALHAGSQCFCGSTLAHSTQLDESECNHPCRGMQWMANMFNRRRVISIFWLSDLLIVCYFRRPRNSLWWRPVCRPYPLQKNRRG